MQLQNLQSPLNLFQRQRSMHPFFLLEFLNKQPSADFVKLPEPDGPILLYKTKAMIASVPKAIPNKKRRAQGSDMPFRQY